MICPKGYLGFQDKRDFAYTTEWQEVEFSFVGQDEGHVGGSLKGYSAEFFPRSE